MVVHLINKAEVHWQLNDNCTMGCSYCPTKYSGNTASRNIEEYLSVVRKLQDSRYKNAESIHWKLGGGEPLQFPGLGILLNAIRSKPNYVRLDTSGGETWFEIMAIKDMFDHIKFTQHSWQNPSVLNFAIDFCKDEGKRLSVVVPLMPGKILEGRTYIQELLDAGVEAYDLILYNDARKGDWWHGYSMRDINLIMGRPEDYVEPPIPIADPSLPDPNWVDPSIIKDPEWVYTGKQCFAGVDYLYIGAKGFASASDCGGRDLGNVFKNDWQAPDTSFACPMFQCMHESDRTRIRVNN
jgi:hypothetical protein